jgi:hypothetical protein
MISFEQKLLLLRHSGILKPYSLQDIQPLVDKLSLEVEDFIDSKLVEMIAELAKSKKKSK